MFQWSHEFDTKFYVSIKFSWLIDRIIFWKYLYLILCKNNENKKPTYPPYRSSSSFCRFNAFVSTKMVREQSESDSIIFVVSADVKSSELSTISLDDDGLSTANNVNGGLLSISDIFKERSTSLNNFSVFATRITDVGTSDSLDVVEFCRCNWCAIQNKNAASVNRNEVSNT